MFHVGQKVVCVDAAVRWTTIPDEFAIQKGEIYTISELVPLLYSEGSGVWLSERPTSNLFKGYYPDRFRPVESKEANIDVFRQLLKEKEMA